MTALETSPPQITAICSHRLAVWAAGLPGETDGQGKCVATRSHDGPEGGVAGSTVRHSILGRVGAIALPYPSLRRKAPAVALLPLPRLPLPAHSRAQTSRSARRWTAEPSVAGKGSRADATQRTPAGKPRDRPPELGRAASPRPRLEVRTGVAHTASSRARGGRPVRRRRRADMDALTVNEEVDVPFASKVRATYNGQDVGVMHACGHDAHVAMLMGAAEVLAGMRRDLPGTVKFIFQPAEEGAPPGERGGAELMIEEGALGDPKPAAIFGLHVFPYPAGEIRYRPGGTMASSNVLRIVVRGRQTHGAQPWAAWIQSSSPPDRPAANDHEPPVDNYHGTRHRTRCDQRRRPLKASRQRVMVGTIRAVIPPCSATFRSVRRTAESIALRAAPRQVTIDAGIR